METTCKTLRGRIEDRGGVQVAECDGPYGGRLHFYILGRHVVMIVVNAHKNHEQIFVRHREKCVGQNAALIDRLAQIRP